MQSILSKSQFKAKALEVFRHVQQSGESVIITDHGQPALVLTPYHDKTLSPLDALKGSVTSYTDPFEPVDGEEWEALR